MNRIFQAGAIILGSITIFLHILGQSVETSIWGLLLAIWLYIISSDKI